MKPQGPPLATCAGVLFLLLAWIGCYLLGSSYVTAGAKYRDIRAEWQLGLFEPLAKAESRYFGYPVCLRYPADGAHVCRSYF